MVLDESFPACLQDFLCSNVDCRSMADDSLSKTWFLFHVALLSFACFASNFSSEGGGNIVTTQTQSRMIGPTWSPVSRILEQRIDVVRFWKERRMAETALFEALVAVRNLVPLISCHCVGSVGHWHWSVQFFCSQKYVVFSGFFQASFKLHSLIFGAELRLSISCVGPCADSYGNRTDFAEVN